MEFLDPKKQKEHLVRLIIGYILVGAALILTTIILLYQAQGFGYKNGEVIQSGLIFVSSRPEGAAVYVNGKLREEKTNARLLMPAGQYTFELRRDDYRPWKRAINLEGGALVRFDYPVLFPTKLTSTTVQRYDVQPPLATQSLDRRWVLVQNPNALASFDMYDTKNPETAAVQTTVPEQLLTIKDGLQRWRLVQWADNNRHVLLQHTSEKDGKTRSEYILVDRQKPDESVNLTSTLGDQTSQISLVDLNFDEYYLFNAAEQTVSTATLDQPTPKPYLENILGFKSHGDDVMLYATDQGATDGKVAIKLRENDKTYAIRQVAPSDKYMLDIARYDGDWYVVAGSPAEARTYVYKNPAAALEEKSDAPLVPVQVLKTAGTQYVSFSDNARFIMAQGGQQIATYDAETDRGYAFQLEAPIDSPQEHVSWMDAHRMMAVVNGKVQVFEFDNANDETLVAASPAYTPFFDNKYEFMYTLAPQTTKAVNGTEKTQYVLTSTSLRSPADQ